jgi:quinol monooxygenase YgiN
VGQVSLVAKLTAKEGKRDELVKVLQELSGVVESEPGTLIYAINISTTAPDEVWFYELYTDNDALAAHGGSAAMKEAGAGMAPLLTGRPELYFLEPVGGKGLPAG